MKKKQSTDAIRRVSHEKRQNGFKQWKSLKGDDKRTKKGMERIHSKGNEFAVKNFTSCEKNSNFFLGDEPCLWRLSFRLTCQ